MPDTVPLVGPLLAELLNEASRAEGRDISDVAAASRQQEYAARLEILLRQTLDQVELLQTRLRESRNAEATAAAMSEEAARLRAELAALRDENTALKSSTSWRLTAPVRLLKARLDGLAARLKGPGVLARLVRSGPAVPAQVRAYPLPMPFTRAEPFRRQVRLVAFYLPQFHPIPENNEWWGEGFTEWTNVRRGRPRYKGHHQPLIPGDLGYYDLLRTSHIQELQAQLASNYGLEAFCFYFYWFAGKTLLEDPIRTFASNDAIQLPFCLCWANENWTRRWDGLDAEVLIAQHHSAEDDIGFIAHVAEYMRQPRYLRQDGKPVLLVYRPSLLPHPKQTVERWRAWCRANGVGEIVLLYVQSFEKVDPSAYGFDGAIEFPPNNTDPPLAQDVEDLEPGCAGKIYDYRVYPKRAQNYVDETYPLYRGVFPSWDNEARRPGRGASFHHSSPELYSEWLSHAVADTCARFRKVDQRLLFINAWNEWAEGAILEPDQRLGYANLQATRDALATAPAEGRGRIVLVVHDGYRHGAQMLALNMSRVLCEDLRLDLDIVFLRPGPLVREFEHYGRVWTLEGEDRQDPADLTQRLASAGVVGAICNTAVTGPFLAELSSRGVRCLALVHEMPALLEANGLRQAAEDVARGAELVVFAAKAVETAFREYVGGLPFSSLIQPQGLYKRNPIRSPAERADARKRVATRIGVPDSNKIVIGVGYADKRKGFDLFTQIAESVAKSQSAVSFVWLGALSPEASELLKRFGADSRVITTGFQLDTSEYYAAADAFALTSREDPYPSVVLEALDAGAPVVSFCGTGGIDDLIKRDLVVGVPAFDTDSFSRALLEAVNANLQARIEAGRTAIGETYDFRRYVYDLASHLISNTPRVSVVVPNFNYAHHLPARLRSVDEQSLAPYELIVLDDCSTDDSREVIESLLPALQTASRTIFNERNSGSVFMQWLRGAEAATGDLVWIAEADDLGEPEFLNTATVAFDDPSVVMSFVQSRQIDEAGRDLAPNYFQYTDDVSNDRWRHSYVADGVEEIRLGLSIKNTIPNVSGVLFRKSILLDVLRSNVDTLKGLRFAGDWFVYVKMLERGKIAYSSAPLNIHRRHSGGVTLGGLGERQLLEIVEIQRLVRDSVDVPAPLRDRAKAYAQELYVQFGLNDRPHTHVWEDERFAKFLN